MLSDPVRKIISNARCEIARIIVDRTSPADLHALCCLDGLLFADGMKFNSRQEVGITFTGNEASTTGDLTVAGADIDDPMDEVERLTRERLKDSQIIEGLQREIDKLRKGQA